MECNWHLCTNLLSGRQLRFCSVNCKNKYNVTLKRKRNKEALIKMFGGACTICGYDRCPAALCFHHTNDDKEFGIATHGRTPAFESLVEEARKCILICANCHAEQHYGL